MYGTSAGWTDLSPSIAANEEAGLTAVDLAPDGRMWIAGWRAVDGSPQPWIAYWDGAAWQSSPVVTGTGFGYLTDIDFGANDEGWAAGATRTDDRRLRSPVGPHGRDRLAAGRAALGRGFIGAVDHVVGHRRQLGCCRRSAGGQWHARDSSWDGRPGGLADGISRPVDISRLLDQAQRRNHRRRIRGRRDSHQGERLRHVQRWLGVIGFDNDRLTTGRTRCSGRPAD